MSRRTRSVPRDWYYDEDYYGRDPEPEFRRNRRSRSSSPSTLAPAQRLKTVGKLALAVVKLGGAAAILAGDRQSRGRDRSRSRAKRPHSSHRSRRSSSSSQGLSPDHAKVKQAVQAAVTAGAVEAFRSRHDPGGWFGPKGERIVAAAIAAAGVDGVIDRNPDKHSKRHVIESALAGLVAERAIYGPRSRSGSRSRSRSHSRSRHRHR